MFNCADEINDAWARKVEILLDALREIAANRDTSEGDWHHPSVLTAQIALEKYKEEKE